MKVLLIYPHGEDYVNFPPLGLGYIASTLEQAGYQVRIYDASLERGNIDDILMQISLYKPNIVGVTILTHLYYQAKSIIKQTKQKFPEIIILAGGPHVTVLPEAALIEICPDYIVIGEGEQTTLEIVKALESRKSLYDIKGIGFMLDGIVRINPPRDFIDNLDAIPFPARHLMKIKKYNIGVIAKVAPRTTILTSRGCPFNCGFCCNASLWRRKFRQRSPKNVVKEMIEIFYKYGIKEIIFPDDLFTANKNWVKEICHQISETGIEFSWRCLARVDTLDKEVMQIMRHAGCQGLDFGVESGDEQILRNMHKEITIPRVIKIFSLATKLGFDTCAYFIIGYPGETTETAEKTIDLAKKINPDRAKFFIATPLPGTDFYREAIEKKLIIDMNWQNYDYNENASVRTEALESTEILLLQRRAYRSFYANSNYLWQNVILKIKKMRFSKRNSLLRPIRNLASLRLLFKFKRASNK